MCVAPWKSARAGGHYRHSADPGRDLGISSAENDRQKEPYVLFLDELNACTQEVQKAFYSLIHERRIGEYHLPEGSIVIGAGNRAEDSAIVKTMSSALLNRMFHVQLKADVGQWIKWAQAEGLHPWVIDYIIQRPDHLFPNRRKPKNRFPPRVPGIC